AGQALADAATAGDIQHPMAERKAQGLVDLGHALEDWPAPVWSQHINQAVGTVTQLEAGKQRLRHDHVTDPTGTHNENLHKSCKPQAASHKPQAARSRRQGENDFTRPAACRLSLAAAIT